MFVQISNGAALYADSLSSQNLHIDKTISLQKFFSENQSEDLSYPMSEGSRFIISGSGTIHFVQTYFYSDTSCTTLLGSASIVDNTSGFSFTSGQVVSINPSSLYKLANNRNIVTSNIACARVFLTGSNQTSSGVSCQNFTDTTCSGTTCTSNQTKSVAWTSNPSSCRTQNAYVTAGTAKTVTKCDVSSTDGSLSSCAVQSSVSGLNGASAIVINNGYAYIANQNTNSILKCDYNSSDGALSNCGSVGTGFSSPQGLAISAPYLYITNNTFIRKCTISATNGSLTSCTNVVTSIADVRGAVVNKGYIYFPLNAASSVTKCTVSSSNGTLSGCGTTISTPAVALNRPSTIATKNGYAYIANNSGSPIKCTISSSDGSLSTCGTTTITSGSICSAPLSIAINNDYAYITCSNTSNVTKCSINTSDGSFNVCGVTGSNFGINGRYDFIF